MPLQLGSLYPIFLRAAAYLHKKDGSAAAPEFQKFVDHKGIVANFPLGALGYLEIARARALSTDTTGARNAYQQFLALWKNADPELALLRQAREEYRKLP